MSAYSYWAMSAYKSTWYRAKGEGRSLSIWLLNACVGDTDGQDSRFGTDLFTCASSFVQVTHSFFGKLEETLGFGSYCAQFGHCGVFFCPVLRRSIAMRAARPPVGCPFSSHRSTWGWDSQTGLLVKVLEWL